MSGQKLKILFGIYQRVAGDEESKNMCSLFMRYIAASSRGYVDCVDIGVAAGNEEIVDSDHCCRWRRLWRNNASGERNLNCRHQVTDS